LITEIDIDEIRLGLGDRVIFKAGWRALTGEIQKSPNAEQPPRVEIPIEMIQRTENSQFTLSDLAELLKILPNTGTATPPRATLQQPQGARSRGEEPPLVTAQTLSKNTALRALVASLGQQPTAESLALDYYSYDQNEKGERCLLPINFVTVIGGFVGEDEEVLSTGEFGGRMV
jgi:hypothetical protein